MAWNKDVFFISKTDADWTAQNPTIPDGAMLFVQIQNDVDVVVGVRAKIGNGSAYQDTPFMDQSEFDKKLDHPNGDSTDVIFADGSTGQLDTLTLDDILSEYHLVTPEEWNELQKYSTPTPSFVATPTFSLADRKIGDTLVGNFNFSFTKTNTDSIKPATGGNVSVNQGTFTGLGDFNLKDVNTYQVVGNNVNFASSSTITFILKLIDLYDQELSEQSFDILFKYPIFAGTYSTKAIPDQTSLSSLSEKLTYDNSGLDNMEFNLDGAGSQMYFHVLVPTEIATNLDIRLQEIPGYNSANMVLFETLNLSVGNVTKQYNHYVTDYTSAGLINLLLRITS